MKLSKVLEILNAISEACGDADVVIDFEHYGEGEGHGYWSLNAINTQTDYDGTLLVNLTSSNEM